MKKGLKIILIIVITLIGIIILDTVQARVLKNSPIISWKEKTGNGESYVDRGLIIDSYYCTKEEDIVTVSWQFKGSKFACDHIELTLN